METTKAHARRVREGFFDIYVHSPVIDIGCGRVTGPTGSAHGSDPLTPDAMCWDQDDGDATFMRPENLRRHPQWTAEMEHGFGTVYSSHCIEHIANPYLAIKNWFRIVRPGGHLIIFAPSRDHYEKRKELPSRWNPDHKFFLTLDQEELPCTLALRWLAVAALGAHLSCIGWIIKESKECTEGHTITDPDLHSDGEYSLELVIQKAPWMTKKEDDGTEHPI